MGRNKDGTIRKLTKVGKNSYCVTLPVGVIRKFGWQEKQKVRLEVDEKKQVIKILDWKP